MMLTGAHSVVVPPCTIDVQAQTIDMFCVLPGSRDSGQQEPLLFFAKPFVSGKTSYEKNTFNDPTMGEYAL